MADTDTTGPVSGGDRSLIERARLAALAEHTIYGGDAGKLLTELADALASAPPAPVDGVPAGWKLVPKEPTREMLRAGQAATWSHLQPEYVQAAETFGVRVTIWPEGCETNAMLAYRAMLASAPPAPATEGDDEDGYDPEGPIPGIDCSPYGMSPMLMNFQLRKAARRFTQSDREEAANLIDRLVAEIEAHEKAASAPPAPSTAEGGLGAVDGTDGSPDADVALRAVLARRAKDCLTRDEREDIIREFIALTSPVPGPAGDLAGQRITNGPWRLLKREGGYIIVGATDEILLSADPDVPCGDSLFHLRQVVTALNAGEA
jgi:hypothetical protein